jgi:beta-galactosidase/beta-glucuronidase
MVSFNWDWSLYSSDQQQMQDDLVQMIQLHASHPAVAMWIIGNELNLHDGAYVAATWDFVKTLKGKQINRISLTL